MDTQEKSGTSKLIFPLIALIAIVALGAAGYFYMKLNKLQKDPQAVAQEETTNLVAQVSRLILLPPDETPTVATVSDTEALKDQPFFDAAKVGDKILIYAKARKAILYSVLLDKILEVAPLNIGEQEQGVSETPTTNTNSNTNSTTSSDE